MVIVHLYNWWGLSASHMKKVFMKVSIFTGQVSIFMVKLNIDDAQKSLVSWSSTRVNGCTWKTKEKNQSKDISGVPAKDPPKVKSEESSNNAKEYEL